jgi:hypothetical protein
MLRQRLPFPKHLNGCKMPYHAIMEVRRLQCQTLSSAEVKRVYHLADEDLRNQPTVQVIVLCLLKYMCSCCLHVALLSIPAMPCILVQLRSISRIAVFTWQDESHHGVSSSSREGKHCQAITAFLLKCHFSQLLDAGAACIWEREEDPVPAAGRAERGEGQAWDRAGHAGARAPQ